MAKKWYVLHTYSGYENKVKQNLAHRVESMGFEDRVFDIQIPTEEVVEIKEGGKRVTSEKKVFPGYVLVRMELDDASWGIVRNTPGVTGFVGAQGKPSPLSREEYNKIMKRTHSDAPRKTSSNLQVGQSIKVVSGPLAEFDGTISEVNPEAGKIRVMVSIFGRETPVELSYDQVTSL
ncbi:MAG: transcription termination/antitermination protein NusG [Coriobacteriales bacterium]|jgi:transcriptional antiterminator NusG|nr:transcription termination/antitermination protein NusG [Coriobacteriales bacterium]